MCSGATAAESEEFGKHTAAARLMREEYKKDLASADEEHAVIIMDFSQNLTLPSISSTPSQWYFLSLRSVNMFGIYYANEAMQYNYVYDETVAGKGTDEVNSMLYHFINRIILPAGFRRLTIYADNCGGQNKNNYVVRMLLAHMSDLEVIKLKFFVKGHTKNAVDRGFGHVRKHLARLDIWTTGQLIDAVNDASSTSALVHIEAENHIIKEYRNVAKDAYKNLIGIQKYQLFEMREDTPGVVAYKEGPDSDAVVQDLRRKYDGIVTDATRVQVLFTAHLEPLPKPPPNCEKIQTINNQVRRYVPEEFINDPLYDPPNDEDERKAKAIQKARAEKRKEATKKKKRARAAASESATDAAAELTDEAQGKQPTQQEKKRTRTIWNL
ncbi:hypothetical protein F443_07559 [Phytophthora nicotianae P1569]|uniref:DUF7869 domain-containing protein n=1 Tax=Phytophthora nicotianae P1569 TaxID=1317065 RepID=V9FDE2_PHYNI|nr:hypothetical protein F443_07559 [Phytophthora nicotianae P1569]